jgi:hypothetical protein
MYVKPSIINDTRKRTQKIKSVLVGEKPMFHSQRPAPAKQKRKDDAQNAYKRPRL